ncbi:MAG: metal ABC transporter permease, partial [Clostridiaceae bacterium]
MLELWYQIVDFALPFEWTNHEFMKNALLAVLLLTPLFGLLGTMVVSNRMAFFSDSI